MSHKRSGGIPAKMYSRKVVIRYPAEFAEKPIIDELVKMHDLLLNILKARIFPRWEWSSSSS
ncbi:MAG: hypothetical protein ACYC5X_04330 [Syntrophales bacterium]